MEHIKKGCIVVRKSYKKDILLRRYEIKSGTELHG